MSQIQKIRRGLAMAYAFGKATIITELGLLSAVWGDGDATALVFLLIFAAAIVADGGRSDEFIPARRVGRLTATTHEYRKTA